MTFLAVSVLFNSRLLEKRGENYAVVVSYSITLLREEKRLFKSKHCN